MTVTSGRKLPAPFALFNPAPRGWSRSQTSLMDAVSPEYSDAASRTWPKSGLMQGGAVYEVQTLERPIVASVSSLLPTQRATRGGSATETVRKLLPVPRATDAKDSRARRLDGTSYSDHNDMTLSDVMVTLLATPTRHNAQGPAGGGIADVTSPEKSKLLPTPTARDPKGKDAPNREGAQSLSNLVELIGESGNRPSEGGRR
jgi:hypothetical protein